jgi:hypothetical protein
VVFKCYAVDKKTLAVVWSKNSYELCSEIQDLPLLRFLRFKFLFDLSALIYLLILRSIREKSILATACLLSNLQPYPQPGDLWKPF